jgi:hypothetical protein
VSILDVAELHPKAATTVPTIRKVITLYRSMVSFYTKFSANDGNILVADSCTFTPERKGCVKFLIDLVRYSSNCFSRLRFLVLLALEGLHLLRMMTALGNCSTLHEQWRKSLPRLMRQAIRSVLPTDFLTMGARPHS